MPSSIACRTRLSQPVPGADSSFNITNFTTNADPNVTARLRSSRRRSGFAAAVLSSRIRKKTLNARRGSPVSGIISAKVCAEATHNVRSTIEPFTFARTVRDGDKSRSGASAPL